VRKADNLPPSWAVVTKSMNLNFLEPSGPLQACSGTDLPFYLCVLTASKQARERGRVGVDTLGSVVRGCLKAIVCNATQSAWWVRVRCALILTQFPRVMVSVTLSVCLYCYTCVVRVCTVYHWSGTSRSVMLVKNSQVSQ